ncbi:hypothetical protein CIK05_07715 [Bdellovibrio sp. qaytius]|nr:hypothetical protein CIK05_07715 [Bdellovibrio sp. qaytius]
MKIIKNNKGFTLMESMMMGALGFLIIGAAVSGISWVKNSFNRLSKRTIAIEIVSSFTQNLQEQFIRYPNITIGGNPATYVLCFDTSIRPAKNSAGGMDPIVKVFNASNIKKNSGDCVTIGYEVHLTSASNNPNQFRLLVIGVNNDLGPLYDETITIFKQ